MNKRNIIIAALAVIAIAAFSFFRLSKSKTDLTGQAPFITSINMPLTGFIANSGKLFQDAVSLAADDLKDQPGKRRVAFEWNDNAGTPAKAATVAQLQSASAASIYYIGYSAETLAAQPILASTGKPVFSYSFLASITKDPNIYRNTISYKTEYPAFVEYAKLRAAKKISVIFVDLPESHEEFKQLVIPNLVKSGWSESSFSLFPYAITENDFRTIAAKVAKDTPDLVMINGFQSSLAPIVSALRSADLVKDGNVISVVDLVDVPRLIGNEAVEGIAVAVPAFLLNPSNKAKEFQSRYQARYNRAPTYSDFGGYDFALIAHDLAQRLPDNPTTDQLSRAIRETNFEGVSGNIRFDSDGDVVIPVHPAIFRSGKLTAVKVP